MSIHRMERLDWHVSFPTAIHLPSLTRFWEVYQMIKEWWQNIKNLIGLTYAVCLNAISLWTIFIHVHDGSFVPGSHMMKARSIVIVSQSQHLVQFNWDIVWSWDERGRGSPSDLPPTEFLAEWKTGGYSSALPKQPPTQIAMFCNGFLFCVMLAVLAFKK